MSRRRTARKNAFLVLYQRDVTERPVDEILKRWHSYRGELDEFTFTLVRGVEREREALDERLGEVAVGWPVHRMSAVDRTIMELAKGFSSDEAPQFVGGVLRGAKEAWLGETERHDRRVEHG